MSLFSIDDFKKALENAPATAGEFVEATQQKAQEIEPYFAKTEYVSRGQLLRAEAIAAGKEAVELPSFVFDGGRMFDRFFTETEKFVVSDYSDFEKFQLLKALQAMRCYRGAQGLGDSIVHKLASIVLAKLSGKEADLGDWKFQREIYREKFKVGKYAVKAKIKADIDIAKTHCVDLKSTTCTNLNDFVKSLQDTNIPLQAAWYKDVGGYSTFTVIGINYQTTHAIDKALRGDIKAIDALSAPAQVFVVPIGEYSINKNRKRYIEAVAKGVELGLFNAV